MPRAKKGTDGRSTNGGPRVGTPGRAYPNRSDLTSGAVRTVKGQEYGAAGAQAAAQKAVPVAGGATAVTPVPQTGPPGPAPLPASFVSPDETPTLGGPSARPGEPLTAGLSFGPGRTPQPGDQTPANTVDQDVAARLRALYSMFPTSELRELIEQLGP